VGADYHDQQLISRISENAIVIRLDLEPRHPPGKSLSLANGCVVQMYSYMQIDIFNERPCESVDFDSTNVLSTRI
jgi:hypothetical protein